MEKKKLTLKKTKISKLNILDRNSKENIKGGDIPVVYFTTQPHGTVIGTENASGQGYWQHSQDAQSNQIHDTTCYYVCVS